LTEKVNDELLRVASNCGIAANVAVGYDNIDVDTCTKRAWWPPTRRRARRTTADFAWTLMMAVARRLSEGEQSPAPATGRWNLDQFVWRRYFGQTLGLVGFGRIGRAVCAPCSRLSDESDLYRPVKGPTTWRSP